MRHQGIPSFRYVDKGFSPVRGPDGRCPGLTLGDLRIARSIEFLPVDALDDEFCADGTGTDRWGGGSPSGIREEVTIFQRDRCGADEPDEGPEIEAVSPPPPEKDHHPLRLRSPRETELHTKVTLLSPGLDGCPSQPPPPDDLGPVERDYRLGQDLVVVSLCR